MVCSSSSSSSSMMRCRRAASHSRISNSLITWVQHAAALMMRPSRSRTMRPSRSRTRCCTCMSTGGCCGTTCSCCGSNSRSLVCRSSHSKHSSGGRGKMCSLRFLHRCAHCLGMHCSCHNSSKTATEMDPWPAAGSDASSSRLAGGNHALTSQQLLAHHTSRGGSSSSSNNQGSQAQKRQPSHRVVQKLALALMKGPWLCCQLRGKQLQRAQQPFK
ncbi:hypothetical protein COO60DRAFT_1515260 [Scenedesmus sp. NREL 46B-D3]|nr:hypothetical protein COO60DRAFT_1515260 [Scenedesmus sp. NREL 46B-D3]